MSKRPWVAAVTFAAGSMVAAILAAVAAYRAVYTDVPRTGPVTVHPAAAHDVSRPLASIEAVVTPAGAPDCEHGCGDSPGDPDADSDEDAQQPSATHPDKTALGASIEQKSLGARPAAKLIAG